MEKEILKLIREREKEKGYILMFEHMKIRPWNNFKIKWNDSQKQVNIFESIKKDPRRLEGVSFQVQQIR